MDKKLLILLLGFFVFLFAWQKFVVDPLAKKNTPPKSAQRPPATSVQPPQATPAAPVAPTAQTTVPVPTATETTVRKAVVDTDLYHAEFVNKGAVLTSF